MKLSLLPRRIIPRLCFGKPVWYCTNGRPNYERELWVMFTWFSPSIWHLYLTPCLKYSPWSRGIGDAKLGVSSFSAHLSIAFLLWEFGILFGRTTNSPTEYNQNISKNLLPS